MLKEKLKNFKTIYLLYILLVVLIVACIVLFIHNYKMTRTIKSVYGTGFGSTVQDSKFTKEYNKLIRDYERKMGELVELHNNLLDRDIFNDFYDDDWMPNHHRRRHWNCYDNYYDNDIRRHYGREMYGRRIDRQQLNEEENINTRNTRTFNYNSKIERNKDNFILKLKIPKIFTLDDVKIDFRNRNLIVKIEKQSESVGKNEERRSYNSFFESFLVPETKAKLNDIKINLDKENNNELTVMVPII